MTYVQCRHQWCWLCNEDYDSNHFNEGKCRGFQFFQPKNDYEIKQMMERKIKFNDLSSSQRQYNLKDNNDNIEQNNNINNNFDEYNKISL